MAVTTRTKPALKLSVSYYASVTFCIRSQKQIVPNFFSKFISNDMTASRCMVGCFSYTLYMFNIFDLLNLPECPWGGSSVYACGSRRSPASPVRLPMGAGVKTIMIKLIIN